MSIKRLALNNLFLVSVFIDSPTRVDNLVPPPLSSRPSSTSQRARLIGTKSEDELQPDKICALTVLTTEWKSPGPSHLGKRRSPRQTCWGRYKNFQDLLHLGSVVHQYQHSATANIERERLPTFDRLRGAIDLRRHLK